MSSSYDNVAEVRSLQGGQKVSSSYDNVVRLLQIVVHGKRDECTAIEVRCYAVLIGYCQQKERWCLTHM